MKRGRQPARRKSKKALAMSRLFLGILFLVAGVAITVALVVVTTGILFPSTGTGDVNENEPLRFMLTTNKTFSTKCGRVRAKMYPNGAWVEQGALPLENEKVGIFLNTCTRSDSRSGLNRLVRALEASQQQGGSPTSTPSRSGTRAGVAVRGTRNRVSFEPHGDELRLKVYHVGDDFPMKMKLLSDSLGAAEKAGLLKPLDYLVYLDGDSLLSCDIMEFFLWSANRMTYDRRVKIAAASGMPDYRKPDKSARAAAEGRGGSNWPPEFERGSVTVAKLSASIALSPHAWMVRRSEMQPLLKEVLSPRAKTRCALCVEAAKEAIGAGVGNDNKNNNEQKNGEMWAYKPSEIAQVPSADPYNRLLHSVLLGKMALTADVPRVSRAMILSDEMEQKLQEMNVQKSDAFYTTHVAGSVFAGFVAAGDFHAHNALRDVALRGTAGASAISRSARSSVVVICMIITVVSVIGIIGVVLCERRAGSRRID